MDDLNFSLFLSSHTFSLPLPPKKGKYFKTFKIKNKFGDIVLQFIIQIVKSERD